MREARKITVEIPGDLMDRAQEATGTGVTNTIRAALELVAASHAYDVLRAHRGKV